MTKRLSRSLQTRVTLKRVDFSLLNRMHLEGLLVEDRQGDTLLYAGDCRVRITDWFIFRKQAELKYIGLSDALIKFQRSDSVWSQQFLFDYFAGSPSKDSSAKKKGGIAFNLKKLELQRIRFVQNDRWKGQDMTLELASLEMDADQLPLSGNQYRIRSLQIDEPVLALRSYPGRKPTRTGEPPEEESASPGPVSWGLGKLQLQIDRLRIVNGQFRTDKLTERQPLDYFDGQHIHFSSINLGLEQVQLQGDSLLAKLELQAKERSGLEVKNMQASLKWTPTEWSFRELDLETNRSRLRNYYSMSFPRMDALGDYIHQVTMRADFSDSYVDSDDIALFAPALRQWKKKFWIRGNIQGTVDELHGKNLLVQAGMNTLLNGDLSLTGLPDINRTFIDLKATDLRTSYGDMLSLFPAIRRIHTPDLRKIRYASFRGNFTGFLSDFVAFGTLNTNLGEWQSDLNMKFPKKQDPLFSGLIATNGFRLGELLGNPDLGSVAGSLRVQGRGIASPNRNITVKGEIAHVDFRNYRYRQLQVDGTLLGNSFNGTASIADEHLVASLDGSLNFNEEVPRFDLEASIKKANLQALGWTRDSLSVRADLSAHFTSNTIDNFLGNAAIRHAEILKNGHRIPVDSLTVEAFTLNGEKVLLVESNEFSGRVQGTYSLQELPRSFTYLLSRYYPAYVKAPLQLPRNQRFRFELETYYVDDYLPFFLPAFSGFNNSRIQGELDLEKDLIRFTANVPQFRFRQYYFDDVKLKADGQAENLQLNGGAMNIRINDSLNIPTVAFSIQSRNDSSRVSILSGANRTVDTANLNALVLTYTDGVKIEISPSTFTINGKNWMIDENGVLEFRKNNPASGSLVMSEGDQQISIETVPSSEGDWNDIRLRLTRLNLGDFAPFFLPRNRLEGLLSGTIVAEDPTGNLVIHSEDIQTRYLRMDNDSIGEIQASARYEKATGDLKVNGQTLNQENYLGFRGTLQLHDREKARENKIALTARRYPLKILERFLGNLFTDIQGYLTGNVNLDGDFSELSVTGKGRISEAGLKVIFTQCFYQIRETDIELTPEEINLDGIVLTDPVTRNPIYITGGIEHEHFRNMFFNLDIGTRRPGTRDENNNRPVLLLNTTAYDSKQFYGQAKGTGLLQLRGPQSDMFMKIDATASTTDSSYVTIPSFEGRESGFADFLVERKYGREMTAQDLDGAATRITYDVDISATPAVTVKVILDELTGDIIRGRGTGSLNIRSGTSEPLSMRGRLNIEEGDYIFTFQSFFKKPFELMRGTNNFIEWNGDPYEANIQLDARYKSENVSFAPLAELLNLSDLSRFRDDVYVLARLTGNLFKPAFSFRLDFPPNSRANTDPSISLNIRQIEKNENELNKQVAYLIVFNSFAPVNTSSLGNPINEFAYSTFSSISGLLFNQVTKVLSNTLSKIFKTDNVGFNISGSLYNRNLLQQNGNSLLPNQSQLDINIPISLFKDRFFINVGSTVNVPLQNTGNLQQSLLFLPDVTLEWLINQNGTLRASFFFRENADFLTASSSGGPGLARRYGGNISFRRDFDSLLDLFRKRPARKTRTDEPGEELKKD